MTSPLFRGDTETKQILGKKAAFTRTLSSNNSEVVLDLAGKMQEGTKISIIVEQADAYINFDDKVWDIAAGSLMISSAGGETFIRMGSVLNLSHCCGVVATNKHLAQQMRLLLLKKE